MWEWSSRDGLKCFKFRGFRVWGIWDLGLRVTSSGIPSLKFGGSEFGDVIDKGFAAEEVWFRVQGLVQYRIKPFLDPCLEPLCADFSLLVAVVPYYGIYRKWSSLTRTLVNLAKHQSHAPGCIAMARSHLIHHACILEQLSWSEPHLALDVSRETSSSES